MRYKLIPFISITISIVICKLGLRGFIISVDYKERERRNFDPRRGPTWMKCLFVPPLALCPPDIGIEVKNYFPLSGVDTIVTSNR